MSVPRGHLADALERSFSPVMRERGERVYREGLVATLREDGEGWVAVVRSENAPGKRYTVTIAASGGGLAGVFAGYDGPAAGWRLSFACTCPVGTNCKHAVAAILAALERDRRRDEGDPSAERWLVPRAARPAGAPAADAASWKTAYWLKKRRDAYGLRGMEGDWVVSRILEFRRTDGREARLKAWSQAYAASLPPAGSAALEDCLRSYGGLEAPARAAGLLAASLPGATLYFGLGDDAAAARPLPVLPAERAALAFTPLDSGDDEPAWTPSLSFLRADGRPGAPAITAIRCSGGVLYPAADAIAAATAGPFARFELAEALDLVPGPARPLGHDAALALASALAARHGPDLSVVPPPSRIVRESLAPEARLVLEPRFGGADSGELRLGLSFSYGGAELDGRSRALRREGDELIVLSRDLRAEAAWRDRLLAALGPMAALARARRSAPEDAPEWDMPLSLGAFAERFLDPLEAAGFRLMVRLKRETRPLAAGKLTASVSSGVDWFSAELGLAVPGGTLALDGSERWLGARLVLSGSELVAVGEGDASLLSLFARARRDGLRRRGRAGGTRAVPVDARDLALLAALNGISDDEGRRLTEAAADLHRALAGLAPAGTAPAGTAPAGTAPAGTAPAAPGRVEEPAGLKASFRPYQAAGYAWLMRLAGAGLGALLADDMGLGKTVQAIAALLKLHEGGLLRPALIVAPVTVLSNWEAELERFAPALRPYRHHGAGRARTPEALRESLAARDLVLTSYQTLRSDRDLFAGVEFGVALLDEAQAVKNPASAAAKATRSVRARWRLSLTGTPVENRPLDLWSHFAFLNPGLLGGLKDFVADFERPIAAGDADALEALRRRSAPFILRRSKSEVLRDLPPKEEITRWVDLGPAQAAFYETLRRQCAEGVGRAVAGNGLKRSAIQVLEALLRLRQAAIHPGMIDPRHAAVDGAKIDDAANLVLDLAAEGHRTLVFSQFTAALALVRERLDGAGLPCEYLDGQTVDRAERIARFQAGSGGAAFLLSLKAGGVGVNLTNADYVILLDPWWNPAAESQAVDRAHRMGQKKPVTVYRLVARGTVEEKVLLLQERKRRLVEDLVAEGGDGLAGLSGDEILGLFA